MKLPIYVISLARATERREDITARLNAAEVQYEIVDAVNGMQLNLDDYKDRFVGDWYLRRHVGGMNRYEVACFLSHYNLYVRMIKEKTPFALILEDDVIWDSDFFNVAKSVVESKYYWNIVHLAARRKEKIKPVIDTFGERQLVRFKKTAGVTAAYLIDLDGAKKMQQFCYQIHDAIDQQWKWYWLQNIYFYHVWAAPASNVESGSATLISGRHNPKTRKELYKEFGYFHWRLTRAKHRLARNFYHWTHPRKLRK